MADEVEESSTPTEVELLQEISNDIKYLIKCTVALSVYKDFELPVEEEATEETPSENVDANSNEQGGE